MGRRPTRAPEVAADDVLTRPTWLSLDGPTRHEVSTDREWLPFGEADEGASGTGRGEPRRPEPEEKNAGGSGEVPPVTLDGSAKRRGPPSSSPSPNPAKRSRKA